MPLTKIQGRKRFFIKMVRPILRLQSLVRQIAEGNLSVRADMNRRDELGNLADSVNTTAEALLQRNQILEGVRFAAYHFLQEQSWEHTIARLLERIGRATEISKALLYTTQEDSQGHICASKRHEWNAQRRSPEFEI